MPAVSIRTSTALSPLSCKRRFAFPVTVSSTLPDSVHFCAISAPNEAYLAQAFSKIPATVQPISTNIYIPFQALRKETRSCNIISITKRQHHTSTTAAKLPFSRDAGGKSARSVYIRSTKQSFIFSLRVNVLSSGSILTEISATRNANTKLQRFDT